MRGWRRLAGSNDQAADKVFETLEQFAPGITASVVGRKVTGPSDWEERLGNRAGNPNHLDMTIDQLFTLRPAPGFSRYRTPVPGLYLSGAGTHPGGGVHGMPGKLAASAVLDDERGEKAAEGEAVAPGRWQRPRGDFGNDELNCLNSRRDSTLNTMDPYQELTLYQKSAALMAAAKLGLFAALADGPATASELATANFGVDGHSIQAAGRSCALEYVSRDGDRFALNDFSRAFLRGGAGGMERLAWKEHLFYTAWSRLADAITSGDALFPSFADRLVNDFPSVEKFLLALNDLAEMAAPGVIATGAFDGAATILDLGGGGGGYAAELARALPDAQVTLADLRQIIPIAKGHLERKGLQGRVELVDADFLRDDCGFRGGSLIACSLSHVLHDFDVPIASAIVRHAARRVAAGGKPVILDVLAPDGGHSNPVEALFDLMMLVEVPGGGRTGFRCSRDGWTRRG